MKKVTDRKDTEIMDGKHFYGSAVVGQRGQIVIPKEARADFNVEPGDKLIVFGSIGRGIMLVKADKLKKIAEMLLKEI